MEIACCCWPVQSVQPTSAQPAHPRLVQQKEQDGAGHVVGHPEHGFGSGHNLSTFYTPISVSGLVESTRTHSSSPTLRAPDPSRPSPSPSERPALPTPKFKIRRQAAQIQKQVPKHETRPKLAVKTLRAKPARPKPLKSGINTGMGLIIWVITSNLMFVSWVKPVHSSSIIAQNTQMHPCFGYQGCCIWHCRFLLQGSSQKPHAECLRSKESYEQCALG